MSSEKDSIGNTSVSSGSGDVKSTFMESINHPSTNVLARRSNIIFNSLTFTDGRDKSLKILQYTLAFLMLSFFKKYNVMIGMHKSILNTIAMCSDARKVIRLANFTGFFSKLVYLLQGRGMNPNQPLSSIDKKHYPLLVLKTAADFLNGITDDLFCLGRFNVIDKTTGIQAKQWSYKLWWTSLTVDLYLGVVKLNSAKRKLGNYTNTLSEKPSNSTPEEPKLPSTTELQTQYYNFQLNLVKTMSDLIFCGYDLFCIEKNRELMYISAVLSGFIGYYRLWLKTYNATKA